MNLNFTLILQIISFLILLAMLTKFLYKPFTKYLDDRTQRIKDMTEGAEKAQEKARRYAEETHKALDMAKKEALKIKAEAKRLSGTERRRIVNEAKKEALAVIENAKQQLTQEKETAVKALRSQVADISMDIAKRILGKEIRKEDHERLIEDSIKEIEDVLLRP